MKVDILIAVGLWGGMENAINRTGRYLSEQNEEIRIVQCVWQGRYWADEKLAFYCLDVENHAVTIEEMTDAYTDFVEKQGVPDVVIATGLPIMCRVAAGTRINLDEDFKIIGWTHGPIEAAEAGEGGSLNDFENVDFAFAINDHIKDTLEYLLLPTQVIRVRNCYDNAGIKYGENRNRNAFGFVGRLDVHKNIMGALQAFAMVEEKDWIFHVVGEGPDTDEVHSFIAEHHLDKNVILHGWNDHPWEILSECRTLIFPSIGIHEAAPLVILEALACGMAVFSTRVGNTEEVIQSGTNGYFFDSSNELATLILGQLDGSLDLPVGSVCRESADAFAPDKALEDFYRKMIKCMT